MSRWPAVFMMVILNVVAFEPIAFGVTRYVSQAGLHQSPFTTIETAATNIQSAINVSQSNDTVLVSAGTYHISSQIIVTNAILLQSISGPELTIIDGGYPNQTTRCVRISNPKAVVSGFIIQNGYVTNWTNGGGVLIQDGGALVNCIVQSNSAHVGRSQGGGVAIERSGLVSNCTIRMNSSTDLTYGGGGGLLIVNGGLAANCIISNNYTGGGSEGGSSGVYIEHGGVIMNSLIVNNTNTGMRLTGGIARNCLVINNSSTFGGGLILHQGSTFENGTIYGNTARDLYAGGVLFIDTNSFVINSIVWSNSSQSGQGMNWWGGANFSYSCTTPLPPGTSNISIDPSFINSQSIPPNLRLVTNSPCIDAGQNKAWMNSSVELDGLPRVMNWIVDMGAYEAYSTNQFILPCTNYISNTNRTRNPSFEIQGLSPSIAAYWKSGNPDGYGDYWGNASREGWRSRSGYWIGTVKTVWGGNGENLGGFWQGYSVTGNTRYAWGGWFYADSSWTASQLLILRFFGTNGHLMSVTNSLGVVPPNWTHKDIHAVSPVGATWVNASIEVSGAGAGGALQFDDIYFKPVSVSGNINYQGRNTGTIRFSFNKEASCTEIVGEEYPIASSVTPYVLSGLSSKTCQSVSVYMDIDGDGIRSSWEASTNINCVTTPNYALNITLIDPDADGDGLTDYEEMFVYGTNPDMADTDGDGYSDHVEVVSNTNPIDPNSHFVINSFEHISSSPTDKFRITWNSVTGLTYFILINPFLDDDFDGMNYGTPATPPMNTYTANVSGDTMFWGVGMTITNSP